MNARTPEEPDSERDPLAGYAEGDPDAVRAAAPHEPSEDEWEVVRQRIHDRLASPVRQPTARWRAALWLTVGTAITASAAAVAWIALAPLLRQNAAAPEFAEHPAPIVRALPIAPEPREISPDPLAEIAMLPIASDSEVVLFRVPGDGWLPVGVHPLTGAISLATTEEVELDDPDPSWPSVTIAPGSVPMIFATKPR